MDNVAVSNYSLSGDGEEPPTEEFSLNYEKIKFTYFKFKQDGSADGQSAWTWDIEKSEPF